jgi:hypothetical protein
VLTHSRIITRLTRLTNHTQVFPLYLSAILRKAPLTTFKVFSLTSLVPCTYQAQGAAFPVFDLCEACTSLTSSSNPSTTHLKLAASALPVSCNSHQRCDTFWSSAYLAFESFDRLARRVERSGTHTTHDTQHTYEFWQLGPCRKTLQQKRMA